jgi:hypothetical protein
MSFRGLATWAKMITPGGKLKVLACHTTKKVNKAEELTYLSIDKYLKSTDIQRVCNVPLHHRMIVKMFFFMFDKKLLRLLEKYMNVKTHNAKQQTNKIQVGIRKKLFLRNSYDQSDSTTLSILTLSIMTLSILSLFVTLSINVTKHNSVSAKCQVPLC